MQRLSVLATRQVASNKHGSSSLLLRRAISGRRCGEQLAPSKGFIVGGEPDFGSHSTATDVQRMRIPLVTRQIQIPLLHSDNITCMVSPLALPQNRWFASTAMPKAMATKDNNKNDNNKITRKHKGKEKRRKLRQSFRSAKQNKRGNNANAKKTTPDGDASRVVTRVARPASHDIILRPQLEQLYDEMGPMVQMKKLENFVDMLIKKSTPKERKKFVDKSTKWSHQHHDKNKNKSKDSKALSSNDKAGGTKVDDDNAGLDPENWMHTKVLSFLDILPLQARPAKTMTSPMEANEKNITKAIAILKRARDKSVLSKTMTWSPEVTAKSEKHTDMATRQNYHDAKTEQQAYKEAREFSRLLSKRLPTNKFDGLIRMFDFYSEEEQESSSTSDTAQEAPVVAATSTVDESIKVAQEKCEHEETLSERKADKVKTTISRPKNTNINILFNRTNTQVGTHVHLIIPELARFFYFDPPISISGDDKESNEKTESIALYEPRVVESEKVWQEFKERFVSKMLDLREMIHTSTDPIDAFQPGDSTIVEEDYEGDDEDEDEEEKLANIVSTNLESTDTAAELAQQKGGKAKIPRPRKKRTTHLIFDAVVVDNNREREDKEYALSSTTTVFVDNLPIDATMDEVNELYSRCGPIESIELFNQRPDLDPGPLTPAQQRKMFMTQRKQGKRRDSEPQKKGGWARSRTPVYAMIAFDDTVGASAASQDSLRIFGMIVRGHSVRSFLANEATRLYIDNIPATRDGSDRSEIDIEFSLSQLLNPDLYVSLDITSSSHKNSERVIPGSCEIMFPSFEIAHDAFSKLRKDLDMVTGDEACTMNWVKTPSDALQYWKRELGGVV